MPRGPVISGIITTLLIFRAFRVAEGEVSYRSFKTAVLGDCATSVELNAVNATFPECAILCAQPTDCSHFLYCPTEGSCVPGGTPSPNNFPQCECYARVCENGGSLVRGSCECMPGYYGNGCEHIIRDCTEGMDRKFTGREIEAFIQPEGAAEPMSVLCDFDYGSTFLLYRRQASPCPRESFDRGWGDYVQGFGTFGCDFWLGLEKMHLLTSQGTYQLEILYDYDKYEQCYYIPFRVENELDGFRATIPTSTADAYCNEFLHGGSGLDINGHVFTTKDNGAQASGCAKKLAGGWWLGDSACGVSNMNGPYIEQDEFMETPSVNRLSPGGPVANKLIKTLTLRVIRISG